MPGVIGGPTPPAPGAVGVIAVDEDTRLCGLTDRLGAAEMVGVAVSQQHDDDVADRASDGRQQWGSCSQWPGRPASMTASLPPSSTMYQLTY